MVVAVADMVRAVFDGQVVDEATKAREAVFRDTNRVNAVTVGIAIYEKRKIIMLDTNDERGTYHMHTITNRTTNTQQ